MESELIELRKQLQSLTLNYACLTNYVDDINNRLNQAEILFCDRYQELSAKVANERIRDFHSHFKSYRKRGYKIVKNLCDLAAKSELQVYYEKEVMVQGKLVPGIFMPIPYIQPIKKKDSITQTTEIPFNRLRATATQTRMPKLQSKKCQVSPAVIRVRGSSVQVNSLDLPTIDKSQNLNLISPEKTSLPKGIDSSTSTTALAPPAPQPGIQNSSRKSKDAVERTPQPLLSTSSDTWIPGVLSWDTVMGRSSSGLSPLQNPSIMTLVPTSSSSSSSSNESVSHCSGDGHSVSRLPASRGNFHEPLRHVSFSEASHQVHHISTTVPAGARAAETGSTNFAKILEKSEKSKETEKDLDAIQLSISKSMERIKSVFSFKSLVEMNEERKLSLPVTRVASEENLEACKKPSIYFDLIEHKNNAQKSSRSVSSELEQLTTALVSNMRIPENSSALPSASSTGIVFAFKRGEHSSEVSESDLDWNFNPTGKTSRNSSSLLQDAVEVLRSELLTPSSSSVALTKSSRARSDASSVSHTFRNFSKKLDGASGRISSEEEFRTPEPEFFDFPEGNMDVNQSRCSRQRSRIPVASAQKKQVKFTEAQRSSPKQKQNVKPDLVKLSVGSHIVPPRPKIPQFPKQGNFPFVVRVRSKTVNPPRAKRMSLGARCQSLSRPRSKNRSPEPREQVTEYQASFCNADRYAYSRTKN